jgi:hypothetical protein
VVFHFVLILLGVGNPHRYLQFSKVAIKTSNFLPEFDPGNYTNFLKIWSQKILSEKSYGSKCVCSNTFGSYCIWAQAHHHHHPAGWSYMLEYIGKKENCGECRFENLLMNFYAHRVDVICLYHGIVCLCKQWKIIQIFFFYARSCFVLVLSV